jgi:hypothetical protein
MCLLWDASIPYGGSRHYRAPSSTRLRDVLIGQASYFLLCMRQYHVLASNSMSVLAIHNLSRPTFC